MRHKLLIFDKNVAMRKTSKIPVKKSSQKKQGHKISEKTLPVVPEDQAMYYTLEKKPGSFNIEHRTSLIYWLGMPSSNGKSIVSDFDIIKLGASGVTKNAINTLASFIGISRKYISENIFDVSVKTLERKDNRAKLDKKTSSHAVEIAKLLQHTYEVFQDEEKVKRWLNKENRALNNLKPVELFDTLSGLRLVDNILVRIEEGVYS
jgi:putative toxin-antitoxin system antitoxin component (TIGR02293 family)